MPTVILGAGIIGVATAFFLSDENPSIAENIHLVDASPRLFASASGYAAGFIARDWFSPSVASLGALSFDLHRLLAAKYGGAEKWGYSPSTGTSLMDPGNPSGKRGDDWLNDGASRAAVAAARPEQYGNGPTWLTKRKGGELEVISTGETTAQVDPLRLGQFLLAECQAKGVQVHYPARAVGLTTNEHGAMSGVRISSSNDGSETELACTRLVIAAGAWSPEVYSTLFPSSHFKLPVSSLAGHSLILKSPRWPQKKSAKGEGAFEAMPCHAVFTEAPEFSPEIFSRSGGEIYVAGINETALPLPDLPTEVIVDDEQIAILRHVALRYLGLPGAEDDLETLRTGLCHRPITESGRPLLAHIPDKKLGPGFKTVKGVGGVTSTRRTTRSMRSTSDAVSTDGMSVDGSEPGGVAIDSVSNTDGMVDDAPGGVFVSAGHGPWGISLSLGTGKVLAEMLRGKDYDQLSADVRGLVF